MFKITLLSVFIICAITACGGSSSNPPDRTSQQDPPPQVDEIIPDGSANLCLVSTDEAFEYTFAEADEVNLFKVGGASTQLELRHDEASGTLQLMPLGWTADEYRVYLEFDTPKNMSWAEITVTISMPEAYRLDGGLEFWLWAEDGTLQGDHTSQVVDETRWVHWDTGASRMIWNWQVANAENLTALGLPSTEQVTRIGFRIDSAPANTALLEPITIHSIHFEPVQGVPCPVIPEQDLSVKVYPEDIELHVLEMSDGEPVWDYGLGDFVTRRLGWHSDAVYVIESIDDIFNPDLDLDESFQAQLTYDPLEQALRVDMAWNHYGLPLGEVVYIFDYHNEGHLAATSDTLGHLENAKITWYLHIPEYYLQTPGLYMHFWASQYGHNFMMSGDFIPGALFPEGSDEVQIQALGNNEYAISHRLKNVLISEPAQRLGMSLGGKEGSFNNVEPGPALLVREIFVDYDN